MEGLKLHASADLYAVRRLVIFSKAHDDGVTEEAAAGKVSIAGREAFRTHAARERHRVRISAGVQQRGECLVHAEGPGGVSEQPRSGVERVFFIFSPRKRPDGAAARGNLAGEQRRRNRSVKNASAAPPDEIPLAAKVVGEAEARIHIVQIVAQRRARPGFEVIAQAAIQREPVGGAPLILNIKTVVSVAHLALGLIADIGGNAPALIDRGAAVQRGLGEIRSRVKTFEEDDKWRAGQSRNHAAAQRVKTASHAAKVCFEGVKQRERLDGIDVVVIAAESNGVAAMRPRDVIH